jgi:hypothetical protein
MSTNKPSTSAKILYRPVGLLSSVVGGVLAGIIFKQVWQRGHWHGTGSRDGYSNRHQRY